MSMMQGPLTVGARLRVRAQLVSGGPRRGRIGPDDGGGQRLLERHVSAGTTVAWLLGFCAVLLAARLFSRFARVEGCSRLQPDTGVGEPRWPLPFGWLAGF